MIRTYLGKAANGGSKLLGVLLGVLLIISMLIINLSSAVVNAETKSGSQLEAFTNKAHDNDYSNIDFNRDFVILKNKVRINGTDANAVYFKNTLSEADYKAIGSESNIKLEYHSVDSDEETFVRSSIYNRDRALGIAGNFHIVAFDTFNIATHCNGNVLTKNFEGGKDFGTRNNNGAETNYIAGLYKDVSASSVTSEKEPMAFSANTRITIENNGNNFGINGAKIDRPNIIYRDTANKKYIDFDAVKRDTESISASLAKHENSDVTLSSNHEYTELHLNDPNSIGYYNIKAEDIDKLSVGSSDTLRLTGFKSNKSGTLIINVDMSNVSSVDLPKEANVYIDGVKQNQGETKLEDAKAGVVLWNFVNEDNKNINAGIMTGSILAPGANVDLKFSFNGTVISNKVKNSTESHRDDFVGRIERDDEEDDEDASRREEKYSPASITLKGTKTLIDNGETVNLREYKGDFTFNLIDENGELVGRTANDANGSFNFKALSFDKEGLYKYTVTEVKGDNARIKYDNSTKHVTIKVTKDTENKTLVAEIVTEESEELAFTNSVKHKEKVNIKARKNYQGGELADGQFEFEIYNADAKGNATGEAIKTATNSANGEILFGDVPYNKDGYVVKEIAGDASFVIYDNTAYRVHLDENDEQIEVPAITNVNYQVEVKLQKQSANKSLGGLESATYSLHKVDASGKDSVVETKKSDKNGYMSFGKVEVGFLYYFKEVSAPVGHTVDPESQNYFRLVWNKNASDPAKALTIIPSDSKGTPSSDGDKYDVEANMATRSLVANLSTVEDKEIILDILKKDSGSKELLSGAKFELYELDGSKEELVREWTSSEKSEDFEAELKVNTEYKLVEIDAPEGYEIAANPIVFKLDEVGKVEVVSEETNASVTTKESATAVIVVIEVFNTKKEVREPEAEEKEEPKKPSKSKEKPKADDPQDPGDNEDEPKADDPQDPSDEEDEPKADDPQDPSEDEDKDEEDPEDSVRTNDESMMFVWSVVFITASIGLIFIARLRRHHK